MKKQMMFSVVCGVACRVCAEVSPYAGLWVGAASLTTVNEVSTAFDADNVPRAPDPLRPTPTGDRADVRLIIHVNAAGQACLLKDVAVVNRNPSGSASATVADIARAGSDAFSVALVTDPSLYAEYPMQRATRFTSVVFDFGDAQATRVLDALVSNVVSHVTTVVTSKPDAAVNTAAKRSQVVEEIVSAVQGWPVSADNVGASYQAFLQDVKGAVVAIASSPSPVSGAAGTWRQTAVTLSQSSPFGDARGIGMVAAVQAAGTANGFADAWNAAANFADTGNAVARLLSGKVTGDALAAAAAMVARHPGATAAQLSTNAAAAAAITAAYQSKVWADEDTRATGALNAMFAAVAAAGAAGHAAGDLDAAEIEQRAYAAGLAVLTEALAKYPGARNGPGTDYTAFVTSVDYAAAPGKAARAAAVAVLDSRIQNPLTYTATLRAVAAAAAMNTLQSTYAAAARARQNELPLEGRFELGQGDARFMMDVGLTDALGAAGLTGQILLPANFPTNPFRHRRHPDHATGFDITRNIRLDFDAPDAPGLIPSVTRGVQTVSGMYREEFLGLHKPLGPNQNIGLRTEGRFTLNRVSSICVLNGK